MTDHGGDWAGFTRTYGTPPLDFSANVSPLGVPEAVRRAAEAALAEAGRYPCAAAFFDGLHAVVGIERFDGAPVFVTRDGGESWERADLSLLDDPNSWQAYNIFRSGDGISIELCRGAGDETEYRQVVSRDWGETWTHE